MNVLNQQWELIQKKKKMPGRSVSQDIQINPRKELPSPTLQGAVGDSARFAFAFYFQM